MSETLTKHLEEDNNDDDDEEETVFASDTIRERRKTLVDKIKQIDHAIAAIEIMQHSPITTSHRFNTSPYQMANPVQIQELEDFLLWKDPSGPSEKAAMLLKMHPIADVAVGLRERYGLLPKGWHGVAPPKEIKMKLVGSSHDLDSGPKVSTSDKKINEILDSEFRFVHMITELQTKFCDRLYAIFASGNAAEIKALGITQRETNLVFSELRQIVRFSQALLQKLDIINLVRNPPVSGEGRAIHVGKAFLEMAPKLHVYAPAITQYQQSLNILSECTRKLMESKKAKRISLMGSSKTNSGGVDFLSLWEKVVSTNEVLKGQQLNAVLITPMQRIPRYKMLLESLLKDCDHKDSIPWVTEALEMFESAARNMNDALRSHEKLKGFFGDAEELRPMSSSGGTTSQGEVRIRNKYTSKTLG